MAAARTLIGILLVFHAVSAQNLNVKLTCNGICGSMHCRTLECLRRLHNCVVILGNLSFSILGQTEMFDNMTFTNLKEITGYLAIYQVPLENIGTLFPSLVRIRGHELLDDYALIIYDMYQLTEIGLYSLLKIDRGGVMIFGGPDTCHIDTIHWRAIAPRYRHVLNPPDEKALCSKRCGGCSTEPSYNKCWDNWKCQRFLEGPEALKCHEECLGCRLTNPKACMLCRHYTYKDQCVPKCPEGTIILEENNYCITEDECLDLDRFVFNNTCATRCPDGYVMKINVIGRTCKPCKNCKSSCRNLVIRTLSSIQDASRCVNVTGSLTIHIRGIPEALEEMRIHLNKIQEISGFLLIQDSISITSIDFLPSLKRIKGKKVIDRKYSLMIRDNLSLQTVFLPNVTKNLKIDNGTVGVFNNPMLCKSEIDKLSQLFLVKPNITVDIPPGLNGYSSGCEEVKLDLNVGVVNETSAIVTFVPLSDPKMNYSVLYVRIPPGKHITVVPETCSEYEWYAVTVSDLSGRVELNSLSPATTYLVCIESYNTTSKHLVRSSIANFSTFVGKPEPPFILELVADSPDVVVLHWVDHVDYKLHITHYELDVLLIDISPDDVTASDQCRNIEEEIVEKDVISRHVVVMRPPAGYGRGCESMCGILSTAPHGSMVEDNFDICHSARVECNDVDEEPVKNTSLGNFVRTATLTIIAPKKGFQVGNLAPYRDYRFRLRACTDEQCSRSARRVVRTLPSTEADVPTISSVVVGDNGLLKVFWEPPALYNGAVLAYIIEIVPDAKMNDVVRIEPLCVPSNQSSIELLSGQADGIRLCSWSLASRTGCTDYKKLISSESLNNWGWLGVFFAFPLCIVTVLIGYLWSRYEAQGDSVPLVNITSGYRVDSDPPIFSILDFTPSMHVSHVD